MTQMTESTQPTGAGQATHFATDNMEGLQSLYIQHLRELYNAENQIVQALPVMMASATSPELQQAFDMHKQQSQTQADRLEKILQSLDKNPNGLMSKGMFALIGEGQLLIKQKAPGDLLDAGLIAAAQHVEHYEIASYGTVSAWAKLLGRDDDLQLLLQSLEEEKQTDEKLTDLGKSTINPAAAKS